MDIIKILPIHLIFIGVLGRKNFPPPFEVLLSWSKNQIDRRQVNRREKTLTYLWGLQRPEIPKTVRGNEV